MKETQHKSALIQIISSHLRFRNVFGMNTNGSNRIGSMKRRLHKSISVKIFIDLFVQTPSSEVSLPDGQGKTESSKLVLLKSKSRVKVLGFLFYTPPKQPQDSAACAWENRQSRKRI